MCVEHKSIQDLFGIFSSGRLYHQVEMMSCYYRIPVLLISGLSVLSASEVGDDLRIVWSRSLHATAEIFTMLKRNKDEPHEAKVKEKLEAGQGKTTFRCFLSRFFTPLYLVFPFKILYTIIFGGCVLCNCLK